MLLRRALETLAAAATVAACSAAAPGEETGSVEIAVTSGSPDGADDGVVALLVGEQVACTGSLIAVRVVLTAAHCLDPSGTAPLPDVVVGRRPGRAGRRISVSRQWVHPAFDPVSHANDVAVLVTRDAVPAGAMPLTRTLRSSLVGREVRIVGFGRTAPTSFDAPTRHAGTAVIVGDDPTTIRLAKDPSLPCEGDSGGPVLLESSGVVRILGVVSRGDARCDVYAIATRVDAYAEPFLDAFSSDHGVAPGRRCLYSGNCQHGECVTPEDAPREPYCDSACASAADCAAPLSCTPEGRCRYPTPSPGAMGTACEHDVDCSSGLCARRRGDTSAQCTTACFPDDLHACPRGYACVANPDVGGAHACVPASSNRIAGASCAAGATSSADGRAAAVVTLLAVSLLRRRRLARRMLRPLRQ